MANDSRARLIAYLCQAGLSTARANAVLDDYTHGLAETMRDLSRDGYSAQEIARKLDPKAST